MNVRITNVLQELRVAGEMLVLDTEAAVGSVTVPAGASHVLLQAQSEAIRYRLDGEDPDASTGFDLPAGGELLLKAEAAVGLRFIRGGSTDGELAVQWLQY